MAENLLKTGSATFLIIDQELEHKDDNPFILWLKQEGFRAQYFGHGNGTHAIYINVNAKIYNWAMAGVSLSSCIFNHAIHIDEFKQIYSIFKKYSKFDTTIFTEEDQRNHDEWVAMQPILRERAQRMREEYFAKKPSYEEWLNDMADSVLKDPWYKEHRSDYKREDILKEAEDPWVKGHLEWAYSQKKLPKASAIYWDMITM